MTNAPTTITNGSKFEAETIPRATVTDLFDTVPEYINFFLQFKARGLILIIYIAFSICGVSGFSLFICPINFPDYTIYIN